MNHGVIFRYFAVLLLLSLYNGCGDSARSAGSRDKSEAASLNSGKPFAGQVDAKDKDDRTLLARAATRGVSAADGHTKDLFLPYTADMKGRTASDLTLNAGSERVAKTIAHQDGEDLLLACSKGDLGKVKGLLDKGVPVNATDEKGITPLMHAIQIGSKEIVEVLLDKGADSNAIGGDWGRTPLIVASLLGHLDIVKLLLERGADVNKPGKFQQKALAEAIRVGKTEVAKILLENGADPNEALISSAIFGQTKVLELALDRGADINVRESGWKDSTPLIIAASTAQTEVVRILLDRGADANIRDKEGKTPLDRAVGCSLHDNARYRQEGARIVRILSEKGATIKLGEAAAAGDLELVRKILDGKPEVSATQRNGALIVASSGEHIEVVKLLLSRGADPNFRSSQGMTALMWASVKGNSKLARILKAHGAKNNGVEPKVPTGHPPYLWMAAFECKAEAVRLLLDRGLDVNVRHKGLTPLMIAIGSPYTQVEPKRCQDCAELLLQGGADVNATAKDDGGTDEGYTPLMIAAGGGNIDMIKMLIARGAKPDGSSSNGETALMIAAGRGHLDVVKLLVEARADLHARNKDGATALLVALEARRGGVSCLDVVKCLVNKGADVNTSNNFGWTPLMVACSNRLSEAAEFLVTAGADVNVRSKDDQTPLKLAIQEKISDIVKLLKERGASK